MTFWNDCKYGLRQRAREAELAKLGRIERIWRPWTRSYQKHLRNAEWEAYTALLREAARDSIKHRFSMRDVIG